MGGRSINRREGLDHFCRGIDRFLQVIKTFDSGNREALPQRSNFDYKDDDFQSRIINADLYSREKDKFVENELRLDPDTEYSGLYFFLDSKNPIDPFFYIGKAKNLYKRIGKHFLTFDYFFYASAFPANIDKYYLDCMKFYADGQYQKNRRLYKRQFDCFKKAPFREVGWISSLEFLDPDLLKLVEGHAIFYYKPCANGTKGSLSGGRLSTQMFDKVKAIISIWQKMIIRKSRV